jgi:hypothetical protein
MAIGMVWDCSPEAVREHPLTSHVTGRAVHVQEAVKHGRKERANPGRDGSTRWRYTHKARLAVRLLAWPAACRLCLTPGCCHAGNSVHHG